MIELCLTDTDESLISVADNGEEIAWNHLLRGNIDGSGSPNNVIRDEVTRYMKEKLSPQRLDPLEYWRKNHKLYPNLSKHLDDLQVPPTDFRSPNSLNRDPWDSDDDSGDDNILMADSEDEDSMK